MMTAGVRTCRPMIATNFGPPTGDRAASLKRTRNPTVARAASTYCPPRPRAWRATRERSQGRGRHHRAHVASIPRVVMALRRRGSRRRSACHHEDGCRQLLLRWVGHQPRHARTAPGKAGRGCAPVRPIVPLRQTARSSCAHRPRAARRMSPGVARKALAKAVVMWLWLEKPVLPAIAASDCELPSTCCFAWCSRVRMM